uniref:Uncharacterized protein n=1 Tax=Hyaloperonospora arabidopsidis (strain Emoy2) TaxID=559515 RepID=M4BZZ6_HYAAE
MFIVAEAPVFGLMVCRCWHDHKAAHEIMCSGVQTESDARQRSWMVSPYSAVSLVVVTRLYDA